TRPRLLAQLFRGRCQPAALGLAQQGLDLQRRSARLVSVVLPLLHGPPPARRRPATNKALESNPAPRQASAEELRARRTDLPQTSAAGVIALGVRQPENLTDCS